MNNTQLIEKFKISQSADETEIILYCSEELSKKIIAAHLVKCYYKDISRYFHDFPTIKVRIWYKWKMSIEKFLELFRNVLLDDNQK